MRALEYYFSSPQSFLTSPGQLSLTLAASASLQWPFSVQPWGPMALVVFGLACWAAASVLLCVWILSKEASEHHQSAAGESLAS